MSSQFWALTSGEPVRPEETGHDWEFLLTSVGLLQWDTMIGRCVHVLAGILAGLAVLTNALMCWFQIRGRQCAR